MRLELLIPTLLASSLYCSSVSAQDNCNNRSSFLYGFGAGVAATTAIAYYLRRRGPLTDKDILRVGERRFKKLREAGDISGTLWKYVAIDPTNGGYIFAADCGSAIAEGQEKFGHMRFYIRLVSDVDLPTIGFH